MTRLIIAFPHHEQRIPVLKAFGERLKTQFKIIYRIDSQLERPQIASDKEPIDQALVDRLQRELDQALETAE
jgi:hypothetical protein